MKIWTWAEMKAKIKNDLDLNDEGFITDTELLGYLNSAIDEAEQIFMEIYANYFETEATISLVSGTDSYDFPSDIYATKAMLIQYENGSLKYPVHRIKDLRDIAYVNANDDYRYRIINDPAEGFQIKFYPTPAETGDYAKIYYLRNANEVTQDSDTIDLPEAAQYIMQHIKDSCRNKEMGTMYSAPPSAALVKQEERLRNSLSDMVPDKDNRIMPDMTFYDDVQSVYDYDLYW